MVLSLLALLALFLIIYQIFFTRQSFKLILKVQGENNKDNFMPSEEDCYNYLFKYKIIYYSLFFLLLVLSFFLEKYLELKAWMALYYIEWILCFLYMRLNFSFLMHFLNVKFVPRELEQIEKEFVIGCVKFENNRYLIKYRILNKKINI